MSGYTHGLTLAEALYLLAIEEPVELHYGPHDTCQDWQDAAACGARELARAYAFRAPLVVVDRLIGELQPIRKRGLREAMDQLRRLADLDEDDIDAIDNDEGAPA